MTVHSRCLLASVLALGAIPPLQAQEPARLGMERGSKLPQLSAPSLNQQMANTIADHLRQSGQLRGYTVHIAYQDGVVELAGSVADQPQREELLRIVQGVSGVESVRDRLTLALPQMLTPAQATIPTLPEPTPLRNGSNGPVPEPVPMYNAPMPVPADVTTPKMPPYAWPTYAPYNNFSRVAYPQAYPYQAWPFIGPCYPFPKVPTGWRSVKLEWQDGYWWFSKTATKHDWWRLRYW